MRQEEIFFSIIEYQFTLIYTLIDLKTIIRLKSQAFNLDSFIFYTLRIIPIEGYSFYIIGIKFIGNMFTQLFFYSFILHKNEALCHLHQKSM